MNKRGPPVLPDRDKIGADRANLVAQIADLREALAQLKKPLLKPTISSQSGLASLSLRHTKIQVLPADDRQDRPGRRRLVPRDKV
jgi:hypothetical protein